MPDILKEEAVEAVRMLLPLAEGHLQTVFDHTDAVMEMFGRLPNCSSIERARATEQAWCDAVAAGKAVLENCKP